MGEAESGRSQAEHRIAELEGEVAALRTQLERAQNRSGRGLDARLNALLGDRVVLDTLPETVSVIDAEHRIVYVNRVVPGLDADVIGVDARLFIAGDDQARYLELFERVWSSAAVQSARIKSSTGHVWQSSFVPVMEAGDVAFLLLISQDVTQDANAELALRDSEARLRHALDASGMGTWSFRKAENQMLWDETTARLFGIPWQQAPHDFAEYIQLIHPADREYVETELRNCLETGADVDIEYRVRWSDGQVRYLLGKGTPLRDEQGQICGFRGGVFDVTSHKELEARLQLGEKMQAVGRLTSGIAHNLNNVLSVIIPNVEACQELAGEALLVHLDDISHASRRAAEMVRQLMLFSRPKQGAVQGVFDLSRTVERIANMCRKTIDRRVRITSEGEGACFVRGNEGQIEQVLLNICLNARDALQDAGSLDPVILIELAKEGSNRALVTITDNGPGMSEEVRSRIFEPFFTTKQTGRGTGLGLASAYAIVAEHEGQLSCNTAEGSGTSFRMVLPALEEGAEVEPVQPESDPVGGQERILVVDDEEPVRRAVSFMLSRAGYQVEQCESGADALSRLTAGTPQYDLVLLDRSMPGWGGEQVLEGLAAAGVRVPVIVLTGDAGAAGALLHDNVLHKPVDRRVLLMTVRNTMDALRP